jgi:hypothetical protein
VTAARSYCVAQWAKTSATVLTSVSVYYAARLAPVGQCDGGAMCGGSEVGLLDQQLRPCLGTARAASADSRLSLREFVTSNDKPRIVAY